MAIDQVRFWFVVGLLGSSIVGLRLLSHGEPVALSEGLENVPLVLSGWRGRDLEMDTRELKSLRVDDYLNRSYQDKSGQLIGLYIAYYKSQRTGVTIHSPKNCLPGAGWEPLRSGHQMLLLPDGKQAAVNMYLIEKGLDQELVLYWYQSHGRIVSSEYWAKIYMVLDGLRLNRTDSALVRVVTPADDGESAARRRAIAFAEQVTGPLYKLLPN